jgi:hypothetical protein
MTDQSLIEKIEKISKRPRKTPPRSLVGAKLPTHSPKKPAPPQKAPLPREEKP